MLNIPTAALGQIKLDVKTKLAEKNRLSIFKVGVTEALVSSRWASVVDIGEDYSLWLRNLVRIPKGDLMIVRLELQLRSPAMISEGSLLSSRRVEISYDIRESGQLLDREHAQRAAEVRMEQLGIIQSVTELGLESAQPGSSIVFGGIVRNLLKELKREPTLTELVECSIMGGKVLLASHQMVSELR